MPTNRRHNGHSAGPTQIDEVDRALLGELQEDARLSLAELGRRIGLSAPAVAERLQRLQSDGVILGYHARLDPRALGLNVMAVIRVRPLPRQIKEVADVARASSEVVDCRRITGEDCYVMTAYVSSIDDLEDLIDRFTPYGQTTTSIVQSAPVPPRGLAL